MTIWMIDGQGGALTNQGWRAFARRLASLGYTVSYGWWARDPGAIVKSIIEENPIITVLLGYSLGGNATTWVANELLSRGIKVDLLVAYDPTVNAVIYPLMSNVRRAVCYRQTSHIGTSMFFGRGILLRGAGGPEIDIYNIATDHLLVQYRSDLHERTIAAITQIKRKAKK